jgi:pimeloyl-ACP methyl ester carboxylesterase
MRKILSTHRLVTCTLAGALFIAMSGRDGRAGTMSDVAFTETTPLAGSAELARRMLSPLTAAELPRLPARSDRSLREQPVDLSRETFVLHVPDAVPANGYGLIVFVPPWNAAKVPDGWGPVLDRYGIIFVSASRSGNDASGIGRREPLALIAEANVVRRYPVDTARIYIAGFSGGSRIAMRLALGYPDVFRGAILNAGSDPIGNATVPLPPRDLFLQFQESTHLVYVSGERDTFVQSFDSASERSMRAWCVFQVDNQREQSVGHEAMGGSALARALDTLLAPAAPDPGRLAACRSAIDSDLAGNLQQLKSLIESREPIAAEALLNDVNARFGGLAAPQSLELERALGRR